MTATATNMFADLDATLARFNVGATCEDLTRTPADPIGRLVLNAALELQRLDQRILDLGAQITAQVARVAETVANHGTVNGLGELQHLPAEYDQACALRAARTDALTQAVAVYHATRA